MSKLGGSYIFGNQFYYGTIKSYISIFGSLFSNLSIQRIDKTGKPVLGQLIKVPVSYGPKQKWLIRLLQDPNAGAVSNDGSPTQRPVEIVLPRMSFEMGAIKYDTTRKLISINKNVGKTDTNNILNRMYNPVPYVFPFELTIGTKNQEDMFQIVEQILPFFTPSFTISIKETPLPFADKDIIIRILSTVTPTIEPYGDFKDSKILTCTLNFELDGYMYGPIIPQKVITNSILNVYASAPFTQDLEDIENYTYTDPVPPGGPDIIISTTPDPINAAPDSDFGFTMTITEK